jgi:flagellum-specific ATP synthase
VEGDDLNDPVGDTVRSIVDGHIVLSRRLANRGHYPAVDVLESVSRVMRDVIDAEHLRVREKIIDVMAAYRDAEDMITIGAYVAGSDARIDRAKRLMPKIDGFLRQDIFQKVGYDTAFQQLKQICQDSENETV